MLLKPCRRSSRSALIEADTDMSRHQGNGARVSSYTIETTFFAYGAVTLDGVDILRGGTHEAVMAQVDALGVQTTASTDVGLRVYGTLEEAQTRVEEINALRAELPFGIDGVVIKADSFDEQKAAGFATRHPHWAIAYKLPRSSGRPR